MLKLIKYELRKARTPLLVLLAVTAALEGCYLYGLMAEKDAWMGGGMIGLWVGTIGAVVTLMVIAITSYSRELKDRSAWLIFITPNSGVKIMASKLLFTTLLAVVFSALYVALGLVDFALLLQHFDELEEFLTELQQWLLEYGVHLDQIAFAVLAVGLYVLLGVLSFASLTFVAVTVSNTLFRDRKWRGLATLLIFLGLNWLVSRLGGLLPSALDEVVMAENAATLKITTYYNIDTTPDLWQILKAMMPSAALSLGVVLASTFGCGWLLDRKVSL